MVRDARFSSAPLYTRFLCVIGRESVTFSDIRYPAVREIYSAGVFPRAG